jgi:peptide-methionine (S)-S-oxide reductase
MERHRRLRLTLVLATVSLGPNLVSLAMFWWMAQGALPPSFVWWSLLLAVAAVGVGYAAAGWVWQGQPRSPLSSTRPGDNAGMSELATLAGGCFWCLEAVYQEMRGVEKVVSGYTGGHLPHPTYAQVCSRTTGHAEAVQITFDPQQVSYQTLLQVFFAIHDPTTPNRQGYDVGPQYRSAIFYHSPEQLHTAQQVIGDLEADQVFINPIVTELTPCPIFYPAEAEHQQYYQNNPWQPYCQAVVAPKMTKFRQSFANLRKPTA